MDIVGDKILGPRSRENCKERKKKTETIDWSLEPGDEHVMRMPQVERYLPLTQTTVSHIVVSNQMNTFNKHKSEAHGCILRKSNMQ